MIKKYNLFIFFFLFLYMGCIYGQDASLPDSKENQEINDKFLLNKSISMYPNPVGDILIITSSVPIKEVQIYNLLGQLLKRIDKNYYNIPLEDLNRGVYMIKIYSNNSSVTKKLIKK